MTQARLDLHSSFRIGAVDDRIFGGFLEHLGRCIYEGVYQPDHPTSDSGGLRSDLKEALDELEVTVVRYPGGNFVSGYHWEDGVGPKEQRPKVRELAWQSLETNQFGTDEFIGLCRKLNWQPMLAVNLGTGTPEEARNWVEYCNSISDTKYAGQRIRNGHEEPFKVPLWCLGNEMDGQWQLGHVPVDEYCNRAQMAAKMMKDLDPAIETVACGSSSPWLESFLHWDQHVMNRLGSQNADYISLHRYVGNNANDTANFLGIVTTVDRQIEAIDAAARLVAAQQKTSRRINLCFDEWNVWYRARFGKQIDGEGKFAPSLLDETYNFEDALLAAMFLMSFIRHADVVKIANIAQLVNVIAPIKTNADGILKQSIFHAFRMVSSRKGGDSLRQVIDCESYESTEWGEIAMLDSASIIEGDVLKVFLVNRDLEEAMNLTISCADRTINELRDAELLFHSDVKAENSWEHPNEIAPESFAAVSIRQNEAELELPPHSLVTATFQLG